MSYCHSAPSVVQPASGVNVHIFDFPETAKQNATKNIRKQDLNVLYQVCDFRADRKTRWLPRSLIGWGISDFFSETAEQNSKKLDMKQDINVFRTDRKSKMATLASDLLRHFQLFLWISNIYFKIVTIHINITNEWFRGLKKGNNCLCECISLFVLIHIFIVNIMLAWCNDA